MLARALVGDVGVLEEAERRQILEVRRRRRRPSVTSWPAGRCCAASRGPGRSALHQNVLAQLLEEERPDLSRVVHHAVAAGDVDTVLSRGQEAARQAARAGSHRQALAHYEQVVPHLAAAGAARTRRGCWSTTAGSCTSPSAGTTPCRPSRRALKLWESLGDRVAEGGAWSCCPARQFMAGRPIEAIREAERAVAVLRPTGDIEALAYAETYLGAVQALTDRQEEALTRLLEAQALARGPGAATWSPSCHNYIGCARVDLGDVGRRAGGPAPEPAAVARPPAPRVRRPRVHQPRRDGLPAAPLRRAGDLDRRGSAGSPPTTTCPGTCTTWRRTARCCCSARGTGTRRRPGCERLVAAIPEPDQLTRLTLPPLGRLLARRGDDRAAAMLERAWELARAQRQPGRARRRPGSRWSRAPGWPATSSDADEQIPCCWSVRRRPARRRSRGELLRYLSRAGLPVEEFPGCPPEWAAGHRRATGSGRPTTGGRSATPTSGPSSSRRPAAPRPAWRRSTCSTAWARSPPPGWSGPRLRELGRRAHPAGPAARHPGEPGRPHPAPGRRPRAARDRADQRRDRRAAGRLDPHRRPPRVGDPDPARRGQPPGRRPPGRPSSAWSPRSARPFRSRP